MSDAYYFSHDSNARHDRKVVALKRVHGLEGYGRFWVIVEILREQSDYRLELDELTFELLADEFETSVEQASAFVHECCNKYKLFETDGEYFWSNSLLERMQKLEVIRQKRIEAGKRSAEARARKNNQ